MTASFVAMPVLMITDISLTTSPLISTQAVCFFYVLYSHLISPPSMHPLSISVERFHAVCVWGLHPEMFIVCLCPWRFKLLSSRHGPTTEVGFIQVCVQNDASSTAYYNTLILSELFRGGEEEEKDGGQRGQE